MTPDVAQGGQEVTAFTPEAHVSTSEDIFEATAAPVETPSVNTEKEEEKIVLPSVIELYLLSPVYAASQQAVKETFHLTDDDVAFISDLDRMVMAKRLTLDAYLLALDDEFEKIPEADRDRLFGQLLAERFVPLGNYLKPTAQEVAKNEQLTLPPRPYYRVYFAPLTFAGATSELTEYLGQRLIQSSLRERLRELLVAKRDVSRTDGQILETLTRSADFGGLGFTPAEANRALAAMQDIIQRAKLMSEDEYSMWLVNQNRAATAAPAARAASSDAPSWRVPPTPEHHEKMTQLDQAVEEALHQIATKITDDYLLRRLRTIVSSRLRGMRSTVEARQLLLRDTKVGGMGLDQDTANQYIAVMDRVFADFHDRIAAEEKEKIEREMREQEERVKERRAQEAEERARWYEEKIRQKKAEVPALVIREAQVTQKKLGPLVDAPTPETVASATGDGAIPVPAPARVDGVRVTPLSVMPTQSTGMGRPVIEDVRPPSAEAPQLFGLVQELKMMTLAEFRRLAPKPDDAVKKLIQKLDILAEESYDRRVEGIQALKASGLNAAYVALVMESFRSGKQIVACAEEKRRAGQDTLSPDELAAIVSLNNALHF